MLGNYLVYLCYLVHTWRRAENFQAELDPLKAVLVHAFGFFSELIFLDGSLLEHGAHDEDRVN